VDSSWEIQPKPGSTMQEEFSSLKPSTSLACEKDLKSEIWCSSLLVIITTILNLTFHHHNDRSCRRSFRSQGHQG